ncbi:MAG: GatB/YqeY domain-containing protein [Bacteroidia bacterium]|nr:GatB/YqeY domain-containing protein [Bacteroidia bacterium]
MSLQDQINADVITAMKAKDEVSVRGLRALKSALLLAATSGGTNGKVSDDEALKIFQKLAKQRRESIEIFKNSNRIDLATVEEEELQIIEKYLPKQLGNDEIKAFLLELIKELNASSAADFGRVMGVATKRLSSVADGKVVSAILKEILA